MACQLVDEQNAASCLTVIDPDVRNGAQLQMCSKEFSKAGLQVFVKDQHGSLRLCADRTFLLSRKGWFHGAEGCHDGDLVHLWKDDRGGANSGNQRFLVQEGRLLLEGTQLAVSWAASSHGGSAYLSQAPGVGALKLKMLPDDLLPSLGESAEAQACQTSLRLPLVAHSFAEMGSTREHC